MYYKTKSHRTRLMIIIMSFLDQTECNRTYPLLCTDGLSSIERSNVVSERIMIDGEKNKRINNFLKCYFIFSFFHSHIRTCVRSSCDLDFSSSHKSQPPPPPPPSRYILYYMSTS